MATFGYSPDFNYRVTPKYSVLRTRFENNVEQRRLRTSRKLRTFDLTFENRSTTEVEAVIDFFDARKGSLDEFDLVIAGETVNGVFVEDSFFYQRLAPNVYAYGFQFEEVITSDVVIVQGEKVTFDGEDVKYDGEQVFY